MKTMTPRERLLSTLRFQPVDRIPYREVAILGQTVDLWLKEGMPGDVNIGDFGHGSEYFGFDRRDYVRLDLGPRPAYETVTLEEDDRTVTYSDSLGVKRRAMKETSGGNRPSMDTFLDFPVKTREDFVQIKSRYDSHSPARYPEYWADRLRCWKGSDYPLALPQFGGLGFFSGLRRWMGTESACTLFYDDPKLAHEMLDFLADFAIEVYSRALADLDIDYFEIWEDFAFKGRPFLSPKMFREFLAPRYRRLIDFVRRQGVEFIALDSDGDFDVLIPDLIEVGINIIWPIEVAAGMDAPTLRKRYGRDLILWGGIDKRELALGKKEIEREVFRQIPQLIESGGYIPHLDHAWPHSIPYANFLYFNELRVKVAEGRHG